VEAIALNVKIGGTVRNSLKCACRSPMKQKHNKKGRQQASVRQTFTVQKLTRNEASALEIPDLKCLGIEAKVSLDSCQGGRCALQVGIVIQDNPTSSRNKPITITLEWLNCALTSTCILDQCCLQSLALAILEVNLDVSASVLVEFANVGAVEAGANCVWRLHHAWEREDFLVPGAARHVVGVKDKGALGITKCCKFGQGQVERTCWAFPDADAPSIFSARLSMVLHRHHEAEPVLVVILLGIHSQGQRARAHPTGVDLVLHLKELVRRVFGSAVNGQ